MLGTMPTSATSANCHGQPHGELALQLRRSGVQVGVERTRAERTCDARRYLECDARDVDAEHDVGARDGAGSAVGIVDPRRPAHGIPPAHGAACGDEVGGQPASCLAQTEDGDLQAPSTSARSPFTSYESSPAA